MRHQTAPRRVHPGQALPYLYSLPRDLVAVRRLAYAQALECATIALSQNTALSPAALLALADQQCSVFASLKMDGKRGSNDPRLFRHTFIETFLAAFPDCLQDLLSGAYHLPPDLSREQRLAEHYARAVTMYEDAGMP